MKKFPILALALLSLTTAAVAQAAVMLSNVRKVYIEKMITISINTWLHPFPPNFTAA